MSDIPQLILIVVIVVLTIILVVLGIQIFFILRQSKETLEKVNKILDSASSIAENASKQVAFFSHPLVKLVVGTALTFFLGSKKIKEEIKKNKEEEVEEKKPRRFFRKQA